MPGEVDPLGRGHSTLAETQQQYLKHKAARSEYDERHRGDSGPQIEMMNNNLSILRSAIERLREGNADLKEELLLENKFSVQCTSAGLAAVVTELQDESDGFTRKIELERQRGAELEDKVAVLRDKVAVQRKQMGGMTAAQDASENAQRTIRLLENRLEKAAHKLNEQRSETAALRGRIDNLRRERLVFDDIWRKLERTLHVAKREMAELIHTSNASLDAREKALAEIQALKVASDKEQTAFEAEWKQLTKLIEHDRKQRELFRARELEEREAKTQAVLREELRARRKSAKGTWTIARDKAAQNVSLEKVQQYGEAFAKIQAATGIKDIDVLVEKFASAEDANFSLFGYCNELGAEVEALEEQIAAIRTELEAARGEGVTHEYQRRKILQELELRLARTVTKADQYEGKQSAAQARVDALKGAIISMFDKLNCNTSAVRELLSATNGGDGGVMQYLGIIEQRTHEILQDYIAQVAEDEMRAAEKVAQLLGHGGSPGGGAGGVPAGAGTQWVIEAPSTVGPDSDDERLENEVDALPLDRRALEAKVAKSLAKRGDTIRAKPPDNKKPSPLKKTSHHDDRVT